MSNDNKITNLHDAKEQKAFKHIGSIEELNQIGLNFVPTRLDLPFKCSHVVDGEKFDWNGKLTYITKQASNVEFQVNAYGYGFTVIVGPYTSGHFMCIVTFGAGLALADPCDTFYNLEKVGQMEHLNEFVGVSAVMAFQALSKAGLYGLDGQGGEEE